MSAAGDALQLVLLPFAASVLFVLIHSPLGVHILRRNLVFADLALAQLSALGATVAFAIGYAPTSTAGFGYALLFTFLGAGLLTLARPLGRHLNREALVGILYVGATAATVLVVDRSPQGAEHVKKILIGSILTVEPLELAKFAGLYGAIGLFLWLARAPLSAASSDSAQGRGLLALSVWDFLFFLAFGVVVTSSVTTAGVLLVFAFLIVPAVIGTIFSRRPPIVLFIAWAAGIFASALGFVGAFALDVPTGASLVTAFVLVLVVAGAARAFVFNAAERRRNNLTVGARTAAALSLLSVLLSSLWLMANPAADQPLLALFERGTGWGPRAFLHDGERHIYETAVRDAKRYEEEVEKLNSKERAARHQGATLPDDEIRRIGSYQRSFSDMARGERFVERVLLEKARTRQRWIIGVPSFLLALLGLFVLARQRTARGIAQAKKHANDA